MTAQAAAMTGADIIGRALAAAGATHAFGIPGGEVLALMQGLDTAGLRFVLVRHENAGGFMAEGLWHVTGALPVLVATLGPGVANAVNVVANAMQDRVPLVFLTGCVDAAEAETYTHQVFDHQALLRPVVKGSFRLAAGAVGAGIAKAIALARDGQPGPVHVDVPIGVAERPAAERPVPLPAPWLPGLPAADAVQAARAALAAAARPLLIAGVDAVTAGAGPAVAAFARAHGVPVVTTYKAKGLIPEDDPLCLGAAGLSPRADRLLMPLVAAADAVLLAGYDPIEMRAGWRDPFPAGQTVIELAPVPRGHGMHRADVVLAGGVAAGLAALAHPAPPRWPGAEPARARAALRAAFAAPGDGWGPHAVFAALAQAMPAGSIVTADSGAHRILASQMWTCTAPRQMLQSSGLCTMACAVPLAAGAALGLAASGRRAPVLALVGDGGLAMGAGELETLADLGLPVVVCVLADDSLALIEMKQRGAGRANLGVDTPAGRTDHAALARAMGLAGESAADTATLRAAVARALARPGPSLIAARLPRQAYDGAF